MLLDDDDDDNSGCGKEVPPGTDKEECGCCCCCCSRHKRSQQITDPNECPTNEHFPPDGPKSGCTRSTAWYNSWIWAVTVSKTAWQKAGVRYINTSNTISLAMARNAGMVVNVEAFKVFMRALELS